MCFFRNITTFGRILAFLALQCSLFLAVAEAITINFDVFPNGTPVPEGTIITDQYASEGVIFSIEEISNPSTAPITDEVSTPPGIFVGMSPPNVIKSHGFAPGPSGGLGCNAELKIAFVDPTTRLPTTVSSADILVFAIAFKPPTTIHLVALDLNGNIIDQDEFTVPTSPTVFSFTLTVSSPAHEIASVETQGVAGNDACTAFDNLAFIPERTEITVEIKPGSSPNSINLKSKAVIPVAILTTNTFDAIMVDPLSVEFGPIGAAEAHGKGHIEDVNGDGKNDLVLHFNTQDTGIQCGQTSALLTGETFDGQEIGGSDSIQTVGCK